MLEEMYPFILPPLPYAYDALEPFIDTETMHYHHDKHFQTYITNLNKALASNPKLQDRTLKELLYHPEALPAKDRTAILNNAGGVYNHFLFFNGLAPADEDNHEPKCRLIGIIDNTFGSFNKFKKLFSQLALQVFGSGWTCLVLTPEGVPKIVNLKNQDVVNEGDQVIILFDVWEHAYYLKYKNLRADYVDNLWNIIRFPLM